MIAFIFDAIASFSIKPLRISLLLAIIFAAIAFALLSYIIVGHFYGATVIGWVNYMHHLDSLRRATSVLA